MSKNLHTLIYALGTSLTLVALWFSASILGMLYGLPPWHAAVAGIGWSWGIGGAVAWENHRAFRALLAEAHMSVTLAREAITARDEALAAARRTRRGARLLPYSNPSLPPDPEEPTP
jgi:hypothetical protein